MVAKSLDTNMILRIKYCQLFWLHECETVYDFSFITFKILLRVSDGSVQDNSINGRF